MTNLKAPAGVMPGGKHKGPRPKAQPQRTCIACRDKTAKKALFRVVRAPDGLVSIDMTGRANGRGAYLCENPLCWQRALNSGILKHALKTELDAGIKARLSEFASQLSPVEPVETVQSEGETQ